MTRRDRCMHIITTLSRSGRDREIYAALETVLTCRGLSALTNAALEDLATRTVAGEHAATREHGCVIFLDRYRCQRKNESRPL
jgi:hypothetical protein